MATRPIELILRCLPTMIKEPSIICAAATIDKDKAGKGTSFKITISKFAEKRKILAIPGSKK